MSTVPPAPELELAPGPARELLDALVAMLPGVDAGGWSGPRVRDREERDESLSWERSAPGSSRRSSVDGK